MEDDANYAADINQVHISIIKLKMSPFLRYDNQIINSVCPAKQHSGM